MCALVGDGGCGEFGVGQGIRVTGEEVHVVVVVWVSDGGDGVGKLLTYFTGINKNRTRYPPGLTCQLSTKGRTNTSKCRSCRIFSFFQYYIV